jgi:hypothetical protein
MNEFTQELNNTYKKKVAKETEDTKKQLEKDVEVGEQLNAMRHSQGWELVEKYLTNELETSMNYLLSAVAERDIYYHQAVVIVIRKLLEKIGVSFKIASDSKELLKKYEEN